jgi:hypothetical protein
LGRLLQTGAAILSSVSKEMIKNTVYETLSITTFLLTCFEAVRILRYAIPLSLRMQGRSSFLAYTILNRASSKRIAFLVFFVLQMSNTCQPIATFPSPVVPGSPQHNHQESGASHAAPRVKAPSLSYRETASSKINCTHVLALLVDKTIQSGFLRVSDYEGMRVWQLLVR